MKVAKEVGLDKKITYRLRLAVDEIATNAIVHGYDEAGLDGVLNIRTDIDETTVKIILEDEGNPFDPRRAPPPTHKDLPMEQRPIGGLGVYLTLKGVDEFLYERDGKWNRNIFIVYRDSAKLK
jgi:anti-sigma regulatory factor (Ser/Thr protein kinase)